MSTALICSDGSVNVAFSARGDYTYVCNLVTARAGVDPVTCASWAATLLGARKNASNVMLYYSGSGSFATLPVYGNSPAPVYVGETNQGRVCRKAGTDFPQKAGNRHGP